jgi:hypothetical protein
MALQQLGHNTMGLISEVNLDHLHDGCWTYLGGSGSGGWLNLRNLSYKCLHRRGDPHSIQFQGGKTAKLSDSKPRLLHVYGSPKGIDAQHRNFQIHACTSSIQSKNISLQ